jgi:hypothetical protein
MPDFALNPARQPVDSDAASNADVDRTRRLPAETDAQTDAETKLARAARSAQRLALLSRAPYGAPTLDLFAEDAERATLQALNTDIRQSTLPGFELPEVFMAAVSATAEGDDQPASSRAARRGPLSADASGSPDSDDTRDDAATLDLMFDDVVPPDCVVAGPVPPEFQDDCAGEVLVEVDVGEGERRSRSAKRASAARAKGAARNVAGTVLATTGAQSREALDTLDTKAEPAETAASDSADLPTPAAAGFPGASPAEIDRAEDTDKISGAAAAASSKSIEMNGRETRAAANASAPVKAHRTQPQSLAAALIGDERRTRPDTASRHQSTSCADEAKAASELDTARATAFADTIDALYAVIADQRRASAALSRRMKTLLLIVVCVLLVTVATGVAQTVALARLTRENTAQQQRIEQLMLSQQATLASFFDTDSAIVEVPNRGNGSTHANDPGTAQPNHSTKRPSNKSR